MKLYLPVFSLFSFLLFLLSPPSLPLLSLLPSLSQPQDRQKALEDMGISVQESGIGVQTDKYYLINLNADPSMNELLVCYLKEYTRIGRPSHSVQQVSGCGDRAYSRHAYFFYRIYSCVDWVSLMSIALLRLLTVRCS